MQTNKLTQHLHPHCLFLALHLQRYELTTQCDQTNDNISYMTNHEQLLNVDKCLNVNIEFK